MSINRLRGLPALTAILLVGACSDVNNPLGSGEEALVSYDVAQYAAEAAMDDLSLMGAGGTNGVFGSPAASPPGADRFSNFTMSRTVTFYDENGVAMDAFHPMNTESINFLFHLEGSRTRTGDRGTMTITVVRDRDMTVSGLLGAETTRIWNGTGSSSKNRSLVTDGDGSRSYDFSSETEVENVVVPVPFDWPLSGTITRVVTVEVVSGLEDTRTRTRTVVIEFNGTHLVPITINGETYTLNLETREIIRE